MQIYLDVEISTAAEKKLSHSVLDHWLFFQHTISLSYPNKQTANISPPP